MISLKNILIIAKFESKILWRSWFFRIFAILILLSLSIFNTSVFSPVGENAQFFFANSWGIPYANMFLLSIGQAAAIIFLATGVITKSKKVDTNEVFLVRPISNADYVLGRALSIFKLFFWLNIAILALALIFNLTNPLAPLNLPAYVFYPLLTSLPTVVFTTGLAFFIVTILRNQPISIILLLGVAGVVLIYFQGKYSNIFDFMAFRFNMMASDIAGFSNLKTILLQRAFYLVAGVTFLFGTTLFIDRLSNHQKNRYFLAFITLLLLGSSTYLMFNMWSLRERITTLREDLIELNGQWSDAPNVDIIANHISLKQAGDEIECTSKIVAKNNSINPISTIYFTLNPGLKISALTLNGRKADYKRDLHIISITSNEAFAAKQLVNIAITYRGNILEDVAHLEVEQKRYEATKPLFYPIENRYAFVQPDYLLLTKDVLWYPDTQVGYSNQSPIKERMAFIHFKLDVTVDGSKIPVSQGESKKDSTGLYQFRPAYPLPQISLAIGAYQKRSLTVDSVQYTLYHYPKNDYFSSRFDQLEDTLSFLITDLMNGYEHDQKLKYPFRQLQFVEVPIQFKGYNKIYESHQAYVQPEIVFWPEKGGDNKEFDLSQQFRNMDRQARAQNEVMSDKEKQANVFNTIIKRVFTKQLISNQAFIINRDIDAPNYSIFPNLYAYNAGIVSHKWTILNKSISNYLDKNNLPENDYSRYRSGISLVEECNELMGKSSLKKILTKEIEFEKIEKSISLKGEYLFAYLDQLIGQKALKAFLQDWISTHAHQLIQYEDFRKAIVDTFIIDIDPIINQVYFETAQPSFIIGDAKGYERLDGDRKRYQVVFDVENTSAHDGVIRVNFNSASRFNFGQVAQGDEPNETEYSSVIKAGEIKEFGFVLDQQPSQLTINTLISQNIPSVISIATDVFVSQKDIPPFEGEKVIERSPTSAPYEIIVDNEDEGFSTFSPIKDTYLKAFLDSRKSSDEKYYGIRSRPYSKWLTTTGASFYGQHIRSAHFTRSGKGDKTTTWTPQLKEEGFYDIYTFMMGENQSNNMGRYYNNYNRKYTYQYIINHGDGKDEISFDLSNAKKGWNYLGSYYFSQEGGNVMLTDRCDLGVVYADAVKWVKQ